MQIGGFYGIQRMDRWEHVLQNKWLGRIFVHEKRPDAPFLLLPSIFHDERNLWLITGLFINRKDILEGEDMKTTVYGGVGYSAKYRIALQVGRGATDRMPCIWLVSKGV